MSVTRNDVAHLREGMEVTVSFKRVEASGRSTGPVRGTLYYAFGSLRLGTATVVDRDGYPGTHLDEVISPKPNDPDWPVGTRLTDGTRCLILTDDDDDLPWRSYKGCDGDTWLAHYEVEGWTPVVDEPARIPDERVQEIVDEFNAYEAAHVRPNRLWPDVVLNTAEVDHDLTDAVDAPSDDALILTDRTVLRCAGHHGWFVQYRPQEKP